MIQSNHPAALMVECSQFTKNKFNSVCSSFISVTVLKRLGQWFNLDMKIKEHKCFGDTLLNNEDESEHTRLRVTLNKHFISSHHFFVQRG